MSIIIAAALLAAPADAALVHHERFDHAGAPVEVTYRGAVSADVRQVGTVSAPGRPATLHCRWQTRVTVERHARRGDDHVATRQIETSVPPGGTRPGWCSTQRAAIEAEVAAAGERLREHLAGVAMRDRPALIAELEQIRG